MAESNSTHRKSRELSQRHIQSVLKWKRDSKGKPETGRVTMLSRPRETWSYCGGVMLNWGCVHARPTLALLHRVLPKSQRGLPT